MTCRSGRRLCGVHEICATFAAVSELSEEGFQVRSLAVNYRAGVRLDEHTHEWPQLVYAARGVMTVEVADAAWIVPAHRAVWVPAEVPHSVVMTGNVSMRTLYVSPVLTDGLPRACQTIEVSPLLRELILETVRMEMLHCDRPGDARLIAVMLDQLAAVKAAPLRLPMPSHPRLRSIAERLRTVPLEDTSLELVSKLANLSARTVERVFSTETGLTFVRWRQRMRMLHALKLLADNEPVTRIALAVGYQSPSAFIAAFKRELGVTPTQYFQFVPPAS
jgi:AraC-like DNA-binding protein/quercetin dioxygenase-like cupin family protein